MKQTDRNSSQMATIELLWFLRTRNSHTDSDPGVWIFHILPLRARFDTRSMFKGNTAGLKSDFAFS